jgi:hypothetical protein
MIIQICHLYKSGGYWVMGFMADRSWPTGHSCKDKYTFWKANILDKLSLDGCNSTVYQIPKEIVQYLQCNSYDARILTRAQFVFNIVGEKILISSNKLTH